MEIASNKRVLYDKNGWFIQVEDKDRNAFFNPITGECVNEKNGVNFGFNQKYLKEATAYYFGPIVAGYIISKKPKKLDAFVERYSKILCNTENLVFPFQMDKKNIEKSVVLSNAFVLLSDALSFQNAEEALKYMPSSSFLKELLDVMSEIFPRYAIENDCSVQSDVNKVLSYFVTPELKQVDLKELSVEKVCETWTAALNMFLRGKLEIETVVPLFRDNAVLGSMFSTPMVCIKTLPDFVFYQRGVESYAEKNTYFSESVFPEARKCKSFLQICEDWADKKSKELEQQIMEICDRKDGMSKDAKTEMVADLYDDFLLKYGDMYDKELGSILLKNGYDICSEIGKNDILLAMKTRAAFGTFNGEEDNEDFNKLLSDIVVSALSRKCKEQLLKTVSVSSEKKGPDTNETIQKMEAELERLRSTNAELNEKLSLTANKDNRKDVKISSLEEKVRDLQDELKIKQSEIENLRKQMERFLSTKEKEFVEEKKIDYVSQLNQFSETHSLVVVGGNPNLLSKIKPIFEHITFILDEEKGKITNELVKNADIVLYKTDSLGHSCWQAATSRCKTYGVPEGYIGNITNVDALARNICESIEGTLGIEMYSVLSGKED